MLLNQQLIGFGHADEIFTPELLDRAYSGHMRMLQTPNGMMFSFEMVFTVQDGRRYLMTGNSYSNRIRIFSAIPEDEEEEWRLLE